VALHASTHHDGGVDPLDLDSIAGELNAPKLYGSATLAALETTGAIDVAGDATVEGTVTKAMGH